MKARPSGIAFFARALTVALLSAATSLAQEQSAQRQTVDPAVEVPAARLEDKFPMQQRRALPDPPSMRYAELKQSLPARIVLPVLDTKPFIEEDRREAQKLMQRTRGGVMREVKISSAKDGEWIEVEPGTRVWRLQIQSPGAVGVRLHLANVTLSSGSQLFLYSGSAPKNPDRYEAENLPRTREIFSSPTESDTATIELVQKGDAQNNRDSFDVIGVGHLYRAGNDPSTIVPAGTCNLDASCYPDWQHVADAVARTDYVSGSFIYYCSGAMINNNSGDFSPLFLTAAHCGIDSTTAQSVHFLWKYRSVSCNGPEMFGPSSNGARFLATSSFSDSTLLEITSTLPEGLTWAGWSLASPPPGVAVTGIHHPETSYRRIAFGNTIATDPNYQEYHNIQLTGGMTEPGSSGSPLFNDKQQIMGELYGGTASCSNPGGSVLYGKLSSAYPNFKDANGSNYLENGLGDDRFGDISSRDKAVSVQPGTTDNLILRTGHDDWFRFAAPQFSRITTSIGFTGQWESVQGEIYRNDETIPLAHGDRVGGAPLTYTAMGPSSDVYYLRLFVAPNTLRDTYSLWLDIQPIPTPQAYANAPAPAASTPVTFMGNVSTFNMASTAWFEWGTSPTLAGASSTTPVPISADYMGWQISYVPPNLKENTTYYFRSVVNNGIVTSRSGIANVRTLTGNLVALPAGDMNFGDVKANADSATKTIVITNTGLLSMGMAISFSAMTYSDGRTDHFSTSNNCPNSLASKASCNLVINFTPTHAGMNYGSVQIGSTGGFVTVQLSGNGLGAIASLRVLQDSWFGMFGNIVVGGYSTPLVFELTNTGQFAMDLTHVKLSAHYVQSNNCPASLPVGANCVFSVMFHPDRVGYLEGSLLFALGAGGQNLMQMAGTGIDFQLAFNRPVRGSRNTSAVISAGQSAVYKVTIDSAGGNGTAGLACSGLPVGVSCEIRPTQVNLNGSQQNVDVVVSNAKSGMGRILRLRGKDSGAQLRSFDLQVTATTDGASRSVNIPVSVAGR